MKFTLLGREIDISEGRRNYMCVLIDYRAMAAEAKTALQKDYEDTFALTLFSSSYAEKMSNKYSGNYLNNFVMNYVRETRKYLSRYGVYTLTDQEIWDEITNEHPDVSNLQLTFENYIVDLTLNAPEGATDRDFVPKIKARFESGYFYSALHNDIMAMCDFVTNYLAKNKITEVQFIYKQDAEKARAIFSNLKDTVMTDTQKAAIMADIPMGLTTEKFAEEFQKRSGPQIPKEEKERLAFMLIDLDPRDKAYYDFIFENIPQAQYEIAAIAKYLNIDMSELIQKEIRRSCDLKSISCEEDALKMMVSLQEAMKKFGVTQSSRLEELRKILNDYDIKARTYCNVLYQTRELRAKAEIDDKSLFDAYSEVSRADKEQCRKYLREIEQREVVPEIKEKHLQRVKSRIREIDKKYLKQLTAEIGNLGEDECEQVRQAINQYDATDKIKAPFLEQIAQRIHDIWEAEDFERFKEIYCQTRVSDSEQVGRNCVLIRDTGRTETKELFIKALYLLNENEVAAAAKYANAKESGLFASIINMGKKESYDILTLNGQVMHPAILSAMEEAKAQKGKGLFSGLGFGKNKNKPTPSQEVVSSGAKFCSACGSKREGNAKFCTSCGNKIN